MRSFVTASIAAGLMLAASEVSAQQSLYTQTQLNSLTARNTASGYSSDRVRSGLINRSVPQYAFSTANRGLLNGAIGPRQKPFSSVNRGPSTTPYLGLVGDNPFVSTTTNYFNLVRPQIEQQKTNERLAQQNMALQRQLNDIASQPPYDPTGSENRAPTGHAAVYMNYGGYYTPVQPVSVRGPNR